jgi:hypothetical protein
MAISNNYSKLGHYRFFWVWSFKYQRLPSKITVILQLLGGFTGLCRCCFLCFSGRSCNWTAQVIFKKLAEKPCFNKSPWIFSRKESWLLQLLQLLQPRSPPPVATIKQSWQLQIDTNDPKQKPTESSIKQRRSSCNSYNRTQAKKVPKNSKNMF